MTYQEFMYQCQSKLIDVSIALENTNLVEAIKLKDRGLILKILDTEF
jgi:hypothetical protein